MAAHGFVKIQVSDDQSQTQGIENSKLIGQISEKKLTIIKNPQSFSKWQILMLEPCLMFLCPYSF